MRNTRVAVAVILVIVGLLAVAVGVIYLTVQAHSLPSVLGKLHSYSGHRTKRGIAALVVGLIVLAVGGVLLWAARPTYD